MLTPEPSAAPVSLAPPTRTRYGVLAFLCAMAFILYLDRICLGQAAVPIQEALGFSETKMSFVHMAFTLAYGLFEVPAGRWGDRFGSRRVLTRIVIWWSAFTALTGACFGFWQLLLVRFLFGAGEAGAYPNSARVLVRWFPERERGRIQGIMLSFAQAGGAFAPMVAAFLIGTITWRWTFVVFGAVGVFWAVLFYLWFREDPASHPQVNDAELAWIGPPRQVPHHDPLPWSVIVRHRAVWLLGGIMTMASFVSYMYFSWYPTYLQKARGVDPQTAGVLTTMVLGVAAIGTLCGGFLSNRITNRSRDPRRTRRWVCFASYAAAAVFFAANLFMDSAFLSAVCIAASCFAMFSYQAHWWTCIAELAGKHLGALFGLLNGVGVFGAMSSQFYFGFYADYRYEHGFRGREQWDPAFYIYVIVLFVTALFWLGVDTSRSIAPEDDGGTS